MGIGMGCVCGTAKCENSAKCENAAKFEKQSTLEM